MVFQSPTQVFWHHIIGGTLLKQLNGSEPRSTPRLRRHLYAGRLEFLESELPGRRESTRCLPREIGTWWELGQEESRSLELCAESAHVLQQDTTGAGAASCGVAVDVLQAQVLALQESLRRGRKRTDLFELERALSLWEARSLAPATERYY